MTNSELERRVKDIERRCCCADEVKFYDEFADFPAEGVSDKIYVDESTDLLYRWNGSAYVLVGGNLSYFAEGIDLVALTPFTITHSLGLQDLNSYIVSFKSSAGEPLEIDYVAIDVNSISVTSSVNISDISVTILGL